MAANSQFAHTVNFVKR